MSKRRGRDPDKGMFDSLKDAPTLEESSDAIFGGNLPIIPTVRVKMLDIDSIFPDAIQPRRAIPSVLRKLWNPRKQPLSELFTLWLDRMESPFDPDIPFELDAYLLDGDTYRSRMEDDNQDRPLLPFFEPINGIQTSFLRLLDLASSILREGLTNPISVSRMGRTNYLIETGERRWLAYHLLNYHLGDNSEDDWSKIPARVMPERSVWRQATENNARQNLNAVSRARQLAILLMDIFEQENFQPINKFENEQGFYAQVADGKQWRIPKDKTEQLLKAMGLNNQTQLRQYRAILRLDPEVWRQADDEDWTEHNIRSSLSIKEHPLKKPKYKSQLDRAVADTRIYQNLILKRIETDEDHDQANWLEFAREQAAWWSQLTQDLDE